MTSSPDEIPRATIARIQHWMDHSDLRLDESVDQLEDIETCRQLLQNPDTTFTSWLHDKGSEPRAFSRRFANPTFVASGAFGLVWRVDDLQLGQPVALKVLRPSRLKSPEVVSRFASEAHATETLDHPGIIRLFDVGQLGNLPFIACELIDGGTLSEWSKRHVDLPTPHEVAKFISQVADALHHAHSKAILHRDIKPSNILLRSLSHPAQRLDDYQPILTDFGLAKLDQDTWQGSVLTQDGAMLGTAQYMSPEQACGDWSAFNTTSEIFSLGIILYQLITGELPFQGRHSAAIRKAIGFGQFVRPRQLAPSVPSDLEAITLQCLQPAIAQRYQSMHELQLDLQRFLNGQPVAAAKTSWLRRSLLAARQHPIVASILGLTAVLNLASLFGISSAWLAASESARLEKAATTELFGTYVDFADKVLTGSQPAREVLADSLDVSQKRMRDRLEKDPGNPRLRQRLSLLMHLRSIAYDVSGQLDKGVVERIGALGLLDQLVKEKTNLNQKILRTQRFDLLFALGRFLANPDAFQRHRETLRANGLNMMDALATIQLADQAISSLASEYPEDINIVSSKAHTKLTVAGEMQPSAERLRWINDSVETSRNLWRAHPDRPLLAKPALIGMVLRADDACKEGNHAQALLLIQEADAFFNEAFDNVKVQTWVVEEYLSMNRTYVRILEANRLDPKVAVVCEQSIAEAKRILADNPALIGVQHQCICFLGELVQLYRKQNNHARAEEAAQQFRNLGMNLTDPVHRQMYEDSLKRFEIAP